MDPSAAAFSYINPSTVGHYLLERLVSCGADHVFGVPGDYVLRLIQLIEEHPRLRFINATRESSAGFMANGYAHFKGIGVCVITYGVGIEVIGAITQAFVESIPLVVISGTLSEEEFRKNKECHHLINRVVREGGDSTQLEIFKHVTIDQGLLSSPSTAAAIIDRTLRSCLEHKQPVYLEIPRNMVDQAISSPHASHIYAPPLTHFQVLKQALADTEALLSTSKTPLLWVGHEVLRFRLAPQLLEFAEKHHIPFVSSLLGKAVLDESHPLFLGVYQGGMSSDRIIEAVEETDCLMSIGVLLNDIETGIFTASLDGRHRISANRNLAVIEQHHYPILLKDYVEGLRSLSLRFCFNSQAPSKRSKSIHRFEAIPKKRLSLKRVFECLQSYLNKEHVVVSDIGESLFSSAELVVSERSFLSNAYFAAIGTATSTTIGAQMAAPGRRFIAVMGDGAFQISAAELSSAVRYHLNPIILILNNHGYSTERVILDGPFNDIVDWSYTKLPQVIGGGIGIKASTEEALDNALRTAFDNQAAFFLIEVDLPQSDHSLALQRLGKALSKVVKPA